MKILSLCLALACISPHDAVAQNIFVEEFAFKSGYLLFQDLDCGELCDAIKWVTKGVNGKEFSHLGLVYIPGDISRGEK